MIYIYTDILSYVYFLGIIIRKEMMMKVKPLVLVFVVFGVFALSAQQNIDPAQAALYTSDNKFALVIGNASYSGLTPLANPVNDATDVSAVLQHMGFTVEKILNGNRVQMEDAVLRLKNRLSGVKDAYGFFFYAGHGVQSGGENYLIPVDASISSENYLRDRAVSVQALLDDLNDAGNGLNVVVLDACRDNPFGWSRSGSRGLAIISRQPTDSIIVYATSAGQRASDGEGRNGLFTSQLLNNIATPGLDVTEVFKRTGSDVARVSNNQQVPAIYSQFFGTAYLAGIPIDFEGKIIHPPSTTVVIGGKTKEPQPAKLWSIGAAVGSSFAAPWFIGTIHGTIAPLKYSFIELGVDAGLASGVKNVGYFSVCPFIHLAFFYPITNNRIGVYAGAGGGYTWANYNFPEGKLPMSTFALDTVAGVNLFDMLDVSYTFRTDFKNASNKISVGYSYRFK